MTDLHKIGITEGLILITAYVTDYATALTMASEKLVKILPAQSVYTITDVLNKMAFVPGLTYSTVVSTCTCIRTSNCNEIDIMISVVCNYLYTKKKQGKYFYIYKTVRDNNMLNCYSSFNILQIVYLNILSN